MNRDSGETEMNAVEKPGAAALAPCLLLQISRHDGLICLGI